MVLIYKLTQKDCTQMNSHSEEKCTRELTFRNKSEFPMSKHIHTQDKYKHTQRTETNSRPKTKFSSTIPSTFQNRFLFLNVFSITNGEAEMWQSTCHSNSPSKHIVKTVGKLIYLVNFMLSPGNIFIFSVSEFWRKYFIKPTFFQLPCHEKNQFWNFKTFHLNQFPAIV